MRHDFILIETKVIAYQMKLRNGIDFILNKTNPNINCYDNIFLKYISYYIKYHSAENRFPTLMTRRNLG